MKFTNYAQIWASSITAIAGLVVLLGRSFGWGISEEDIIFGLGVLANAGGVLWTVLSLFKKEKQLGTLRGQVVDLGGSIIE